MKGWVMYRVRVRGKGAERYGVTSAPMHPLLRRVITNVGDQIVDEFEPGYCWVL